MLEGPVPGCSWQDKILKDIEGHEGYDKLNLRYRSLLQLTLNFYSSAMSQAATKLKNCKW